MKYMKYKKLTRGFYLDSAENISPHFLGKYLVHVTSQGRISGMISEVEAYPAFLDDVSHGNKRTKRTEVMYKEGGYAYVYLIYGIHYQFAVVVNKKDIPEVVFIRALIPDEGVELMKSNFQKIVKHSRDLTKSPGNLCKSFGISTDHYGMDITKNELFLEDRGSYIPFENINIRSRIGIRPSIKGNRKKLNYSI